MEKTYSIMRAKNFAKVGGAWFVHIQNAGVELEKAPINCYIEGRTIKPIEGWWAPSWSVEVAKRTSITAKKRAKGIQLLKNSEENKNILMSLVLMQDADATSREDVNMSIETFLDELIKKQQSIK